MCNTFFGAFLMGRESAPDPDLSGFGVRQCSDGADIAADREHDKFFSEAAEARFPFSFVSSGDAIAEFKRFFEIGGGRTADIRPGRLE